MEEEETGKKWRGKMTKVNEATNRRFSKYSMSCKRKRCYVCLSFLGVQLETTVLVLASRNQGSRLEKHTHTRTRLKQKH